MILNGSVEVIQKGRAPITKHLGDSFGVNTTPGSVYNKGIMRTRVDDCQVGLSQQCSLQANLENRICVWQFILLRLVV